MTQDLIPLFVYAELENNIEPDSASTMGTLRERGSDGAAQFGPLHRIVYGQVKYISLAALHDLDAFEAPEYQRVNIMVNVDNTVIAAWAYAYCLADFDSLPRIYSGRFQDATQKDNRL